MSFDNQELFAITLKDKKGRFKRLFFSSPKKTTKKMAQEIVLKTEVLAENNYSIDIICQSAEEVASKYNSVRVAH